MSVGESRTIKAPPRAAAMIESMRDIGYSLATALADIIDNAITAESSRVEIRTHYQGADSRIGILDNGRGLSEEELVTAMRPGSQSPREERAASDLGRFGLGLKTASFSQARSLTVVSSQEGARTAARWDLDRVVAEDEWTLELPEVDEGIPWQASLGVSGTLVVWDCLDRVLGDDFHVTEQEFDHAVAEVGDHLSLVFHRFLMGTHGAPKLDILLNGAPLDAYDPFFTKKSTAGPLEPLEIGDTRLSLQTFTLPHHGSVSADEWDHYAGPEGYVKNQGFYVFRGNRLIVHGTWFGLARQRELTKLTRIAVNLPNKVDAHWKIDVKKASAQPPAPIKRRLRQLTERLHGPSRAAFRHRGAAETSQEARPVWVRVQKDGQVYYDIDRGHPVVSELLSSADREFGELVLAALALIASALPLASLHHDVSADPVRTRGGEMEPAEFDLAARLTASRLLEDFDDPEVVRAMLRTAEPFKSDWDRTEAAVSGLLEEHNDG